MKLKLIEQQLLKIEELRQKGEVRDLVHHAQNMLIEAQTREHGLLVALWMSLLVNAALLLEVVF